MLTKVAAILSVVALVGLGACHLPEDKGKNGGVATPAISLLTVTQVFDHALLPVASQVAVTHNGAIALQGTLTGPRSEPTPSPASLATGKVDPGIYNMKVSVVGCSTSCGGRVLLRCHKNITVAQDERVTAVIHISAHKCEIETTG